MDKLDRSLLYELMAWRDEVLRLVRTKLKYDESLDLAEAIHNIESDCDVLLEHWEKQQNG